MSISFSRSTALLATGCALAAASIVAAAPATASAPTQRRGIVYLHSAGNHIIGRSSIRPGVVQVHNSGARPIFLISSAHGTASKLAKDLKHPADKFPAGFTLRDVLLPHHGAWLRLNRGSLLAFDPTREHISASTIHTTTVKGKTVNAPLPFAHAVTVSAHNVLRVPANVARRTVFHVVNNSHRIQSVGLFRVGSDTSLAQIKDFVAHPSLEKFAKLDLVSSFNLAYVSPHQTVWTRFNGSKGNGVVMSVALSGRATEFLTKHTVGAIHFH